MNRAIGSARTPALTDLPVISSSNGSSDDLAITQLPLAHTKDTDLLGSITHLCHSAGIRMLSARSYSGVA